MAVPEKFHGLSLADSMSLDAHKWLYQPLDCGCLIYRDRQVAREAFAHSGDYIKVFNEGPTETFVFFEEFNGALAAFPRAKALDVVAIPWTPGLS